MARQKGVPRFGRHQIVAGYIMLIVSGVLWIADGSGWEPFNRDLDFGILPWALLVMGGLICFQFNLVRILRGALQINEETEEEKA